MVLKFLSADRSDEEWPIVGRGGAQDSTVDVQLRLPRGGFPEAIQKAGAIRSPDGVKYLKQHQFGERRRHSKDRRFLPPPPYLLVQLFCTFCLFCFFFSYATLRDRYQFNSCRT